MFSIFNSYFLKGPIHVPQPVEGKPLCRCWRRVTLARLGLHQNRRVCNMHGMTLDIGKVIASISLQLLLVVKCFMFLYQCSIFAQLQKHKHINLYLIAQLTFDGSSNLKCRMYKQFFTALNYWLNKLIWLHAISQLSAGASCFCNHA